jgi:uncharacterized protein (TIGR03382 family)
VIPSFQGIRALASDGTDYLLALHGPNAEIRTYSFSANSGVADGGQTVLPSTSAVGEIALIPEPGGYVVATYGKARHLTAVGDPIDIPVQLPTSSFIQKLTFDGRYVNSFGSQTAFGRLDLDGGVRSYFLPAGLNLSFLAASSAGNSASLLLSHQVPDLKAHLYRSHSLNPGETCSDADDCLSGFCEDRVCCQSGCGDSSATDCQACSRDAGASTNGLCGLVTSGVLCRPALGACDVREVCDGVSLACPADQVVDAGTLCRAGESQYCIDDTFCDGVAPGCPLIRVPPGTPCDDGNDCTVSDLCGDAGYCTEHLSVLDAGAVCRSPDSCAIMRCLAGGFCQYFGYTTCPAPSQCHAAGCQNIVGCVTQALTGFACDAGNPCTDDDRCSSGVCVPGTPRLCPAVPCQVGTCDPLDGGCGYVPATDGTACSDQNLCTSGDRCVAGQCVPGIAAVCTQPASGPCKRPYACRPDMGLCFPGENLPDGTACDDADLCTSNDACVAGTCTGPRTDCPGAGPCHNASRCEPTSGQCVLVPIDEGLVCDDGMQCTLEDRCRSGACVGTIVECGAAPECHRYEPCALEKTCASRTLPDGEPCGDAGLCTDGECKAKPAPTCGCTAGGAPTGAFVLLAFALQLARRKRGVLENLRG